MYRYKLATGPKAYAKAERFLSKEGIKHAPLELPTILAYDGRKVVGVISTDTRQEMVVCSALHVRHTDKKRIWTVLRLIDAYENILQKLKIKSYIFAAKASDTKWLDYIKRTFNIEPYAGDSEQFYFVRRMES